MKSPPDQEIVKWTLKEIPLKELKDHPKNPRQIGKEQFERLGNLINKFGMIDKPIVNQDMTLIGGHQRVRYLKKIKDKTVECWVADRQLSDADIDELCIGLNLHQGTWDYDVMANQWEPLDLLKYGFTEEQLLGATKEAETELVNHGKMKEEFGYTPFSVFDTRTSDWQQRRRYWLEKVGIKDLAGRKDDLMNMASAWLLQKGKAAPKDKLAEGTSSFDPMLAEIIYSWFVPINGTILDPFAGGVTRGCVAAALGYKYTGVDIRQEQIDSNLTSFTAINEGLDEKIEQPNWICGDSKNIGTLAEGAFEFIFSCPPYGDLETYSDLPGDISNMPYSEFRETYFEIIGKCCSKLTNNSFACFVVGEIRDKKGNYQNFVGDTINAFLAAGLQYYNEAILINSVGTLPVRCGKPFEASRKLGKHHQNILIFVKGCPKKASTKIGTVKFNMPPEEEATLLGGE